MRLSILVPVFNEKHTILSVLQKLAMVSLPCKREIIVVNDGSTDGTKREIEKFARKKWCKIIHHAKNQGKGMAIQTGIHSATGDFILIQDADLEYNPLEIPKLLAPILDVKKRRGRPHLAVYGSRFLRYKKNGDIHIPSFYLFGNKLLTFLTNLCYGTKLTDMETGYKLLPSSFLKATPLHAPHFNIEPEITAKLIRAKIPIYEVPISYKGRSHLAGKKLTPMDAFEAIYTLFYFRFFP